MSSPEPENWWSRPCGPGDVLRLALPLVISTATWTLMTFCDRMFLMWHSPQEMAATLPASMVHFAVLCFPLGICTYTNTFVAQYYGARRYDRIGIALGQGLRVAMFAAPVLLLMAPFMPQVFLWAGHEPQLASYESIYYQVLSLGAVAVLANNTLRSFFMGRGETRTCMAVDCSGAVLNVVLDAIFIFGLFGFADGGIEGAAWATVISLWAKAAVFSWLVCLPEFRQQYGIAGMWKYDPAVMRRLLYYGAPNGFQFFIDVAGFAVFTLLVGSLGAEAMTATTLAFNVNSVAFVPMIGIGMAISTIVGQQQGAGRPDLSQRATWSGFYIASVYMGMFAVMYLAVPDLFLFGFAAGADAEEFAGLRATVVVLLRFVAAYCMFDAMNVVFVSAVKGAGDTQFVVWANAVIAAAGVGIGFYGVNYLGWGLISCWWLVTGWISAMGIVFFLRFLQGRWKSMQVIEEDAVTVVDLVTPDESVDECEAASAVSSS